MVDLARQAVVLAAAAAAAAVVAEEAVAVTARHRIPIHVPIEQPVAVKVGNSR